jgi:predicted transposase YbfD/YdcC
MNIFDFAQQLPDYRQEWKISHLATDIVFITVAAVICGAQDWSDVQYFGVCKEQFFRRYLLLPNGIPSHDTFNRFFAGLNPQVMEQQFRIRVKTLCSENSRLVCIDGKTIRGAKNAGKSLFHMVSAFCHANGVCLGQVRTAEKSNEITAIPELIKAPDLQDCIVSIDAMGCQSAIADDIIEAGADYILAVKGNQKELLQGIEDTFRFQERTEASVAEELDFGHGRIENRTCRISNNLEYIDTAKWKNAQTLVKTVGERYNKTLHRQEETAVRYYISSLNGKPEDFNRLVRSHWSIENGLHWQLDVCFGEDASRKRQENSPVNFSTVFKTALTMLKRYRFHRGNPSIKTKRKMGGWSDECLIEMLGIDPT